MHPLGKSLVGTQYIKHRITIWLRNSTPSGTPKIENICSKKACKLVFTAALTIAERLKQPKCPSTDEWINTMWYIYTMEYYSATTRNEVLIHDTTWMNLEKIILSEKSQTQKATYLVIPSMWNVQSGPIHSGRR